MDEISRGSRLLRLGMVVVVVAVLAVIAFALRGGAGNADVRPLYVNDRMKLWESSSPAVKQATADMLLDQLHEDGKLGPQTMAALRDGADRQRLVDDLIAALDAATDSNRKEYVSPGDTILKTAETAAARLGWNK